MSAIASNNMGLGWLDVTEKGSVLGIRILVWITTVFGRPPARFVLRFVALYYIVFHAAVRRASRDYLQRVHGTAKLTMIYRHLLSFANVSLDRMFIAKKRNELFQVIDCGTEHVRKLGRQRRGAILLGAHLGSFDALRMQGETDELRINIIGNFHNARMINAALEQLNPGINTRVIDVDENNNMGFVLQIKECIGRGEMVAILGDRVNPGVSTASVPFFGADAQFPTGAFQLAALLRCPIYLTFGLYREPNRYELHCEPFEDEVKLPRKARSEHLRAYALRYAQRLEYFTRLAPDNWFNFYDFWEHRPEASDACPAQVAAHRLDVG